VTEPTEPSADQVDGVRVERQGTSHKTLLSNTLYAFGGTGGTAIAQALAGVLLLVWLSKFHYGVLTSAGAWIDPVRRLTVFGLDTIGLQRVRADAPGGPVALIAAALVVLPASVSAPLQVAFQARHQNHRLLAMPILSAIAQPGVLDLLYLADASIVDYIAAISKTDLVNAALIVGLLRGEQGKVWRGVDAALARSMLREAAPLGCSYVVVMLYKRLGFYFVEAQHGVEAVAALGAAVQPSAPAVGLGGALSVSMGPYAAQLAANGELRELRRVALRTTSKVLAFLAPITLLLAVAAIPATARWAPDYVDAARAFGWMSTAGLFMFVVRTTTSILVRCSSAHVRPQAA